MRNILFGLTALILSAVAVTAIAGQALAYRGDPNVNGPYYSADRHEAMEEAFDNNDYNAWKSLMDGRGKVNQVINESNFAQFSQAHKLAEQGKYEEANKIRQDLGLGDQSVNGTGNCMGQRWNND